ncbi:MAG TPA: carboxypeptidase regulatory-like domain-containing protein, partial [Terriglobales bacterium]|nr:carboxypeptidase regulatory-like domain-containing protein [Terriglobales bacterium]
SNTSKPPRTYNPDRSMNIALPAGAQIEDSLVSGPGGMPVKSAPVPGATPGEYGFVYPIRPGQTTFSVMYRLPYGGKLAFEPKPRYSFQHFAVEVPKSMSLEPASGLLKSMPEKEGVVAVLASNVKPGDDLKFGVSGTGDFPRDQQGGDATADNGSGGAPAANAPRPGGGIGAPEGTPDPLNQYRWWILGGLAAVLAGGAVYVVKRPNGVAAAPASSNGSAAAAVPALRANGSLIEVLKEELFQLEVEQHQGRITAAEYARVKAALDVVIARAVQRVSKPL